MKSVIAALCFCIALPAMAQVPGFPIPQGNPNQLFFLQRTPNINTIVCELNFKTNGELNEDEPVHVFWIRYGESGQRAELSFIQRNFAYGVKTRLLSKDKYELHFVSYKKAMMYLTKAADNKYHVFTSINQKQAILNRIYIKINPGGSFWSPNIEYVELAGTEPGTNKEVLERRKI
ncbi:MAG: DUF4833 domain-containing protein [Bacteroidetes bacterium]|nr:DUF4833 domain-containing protein [Bacteroidota bacterium]